MKQTSYSYKRLGYERYTFVSNGRNRIVKAVEFPPTIIENLYNLSFGDLLPNSLVDDRINSNNGDILKVLATVVQIIRDFTTQFPEIKIVFLGSTKERTKLYARILQMYYDDFRKEFIITARMERIDGHEEVIFDPSIAFEYSAFFIKRID